ncbi:MAG: N-formylglutamate amidohydrolase [Hyphomicrobiales bacterium]|nr:N-formylglutamate amidohydrolase [Hyphomicrobiales bacterium]
MSPASDAMTGGLLGPNDVSPWIGVFRDGTSPLVFCADHAGARIPVQLGDIGMAPADLQDHIALDIGILGTSNWLAGFLNAPLIAQTYSRLVIDCNRKPGTSNSIPEVSDGRVIPTNANLDQAARRAREIDIFHPYHDAVARTIQSAAASLSSRPLLVAMHSFTRRFNGRDREWDIGILHAGASYFADRLIVAIADGSGLAVGRNVPYQISLEEDYTLPVHAKNGTLPHIEIEICQDLIATCDGQRRMSDILFDAFRRVLAEV